MSDMNQPIGTVETSEGSVWAVRADGTRVELQSGDPVFQGDQIGTGGQGAIGVEFNDGSTFSLGASGGMTIDEMIYDPSTQEGSSFFTVAQGAFSFVSGAISKTTPDGMMVQTPVATIGVRGTKVVGEAAPEGSENSFTLMREDDGSTGEIVVYNEGGIQVLNQPFQTVSLNDASGVPDPVFSSPDEINARFEATLRALPEFRGNGPRNEDGAETEESGPPLPEDGTPAEEAAGEEGEELPAGDGEQAGPDGAEILGEAELEAGPAIEDLPGEGEGLEEEAALGSEEALDGEAAGPDVPATAAAGTFQSAAASDDFSPSAGSGLNQTQFQETAGTDPFAPAGNGPQDPIQTASLEQVIQAGLNAGFTNEQIFKALSSVAGNEVEDTTDAGDDADDDLVNDAVSGGVAGSIIGGQSESDEASESEESEGGEQSEQVDDPMVLYGGNGSDSLTGGSGDDTITGDNGADSLYGMGGNDVIHGGNAPDYLSGGDGNDLITGANGGDELVGGDGDDTLYGGQGNDIIDGGAGADTLSGDVGSDTFRFNSAADGYAKTSNGAATAAELAEVSRIIDFETGSDKLSFNGSGFGGISSLVDGLTAIKLDDVFDGTNVDSAVFQAGQPVLIYDNTGTLYYDANGAGEGYSIVAKVDGQVEFTDIELESGSV